VHVALSAQIICSGAPTSASRAADYESSTQHHVSIPRDLRKRFNDRHAVELCGHVFSMCPQRSAPLPRPWLPSLRFYRPLPYNAVTCANIS
jgi:hypothetical protein